jgi:hypothetical protein
MEDAKVAGLLSKDTWKKYPEAMLRARCVAIVARALFPDAIMGASYTPEELESVPSKHTVYPDQPAIGDGVLVEKPGTISKGTFAKRNISELSKEELTKLVDLLESKPNCTIAELQDLDRAKEHLFNLNQMDASDNDSHEGVTLLDVVTTPKGGTIQPEPKLSNETHGPLFTTPPVVSETKNAPFRDCNCGNPMSYSEKRGLWYCPFKKSVPGIHSPEKP